MRPVAAVLALPLAVLTAPVLAGEEVLYKDAPDWVAAVDFEAALDQGEPFVLLDKQIRIEGGVVHNYRDMAYEIENADALANLGTVKLVWLPDKGDLTVHRLQIIRDGAEIDLLADGVTFDVLRRERDLEKRSLDGALTATIAVPGLEVGDVLRISQTVSRRDQALEGDTQVSGGLIAEPTKVGFARTRVSWPDDDKMVWKTHNFAGDIEPVSKNGFTSLTILQPIEEPDEMPEDAPLRFKVRPTLQVTSFDSWEGVSARLAPHFSTQGAITDGDGIDAVVQKIMADATDEKVRAASALRWTQDEISYLLNGLDGGNYLPQSPAETFKLRYGDCKAKSLILLSMLRRMGIEAEAVLVHSRNGDIVPHLASAPGAFDHMIVRAVIDGQDYWLDGTSRGVRLDTMDEVPNFEYALPLRDGGAGLMTMEQRWPSTLDRTMRVTYDYRPGVEFPVLYDAVIEARGSMGASFRALADETDEDDLRARAAEYMKKMLGEGIVYAASVSYDEESGLATMTASGLQSSKWKFENGRGTFKPRMVSTGLKFAPDRGRAIWRDVPVAVNGPVGVREEWTLLLPESAEEFTLSGRPDFEMEVAGRRIKRSARVDGQTAVLIDTLERIPMEIAPSDLSKHRAGAARSRAADPVLRAPDTVVRYWQDDVSDKARVARLEDAYATIIDQEPDEGWRYGMRAALRELYYDYDAALEDYTKAIDLEGDAETFAERSDLLLSMNRLDEALEDALVAFDYEPTARRASSVADIYAELDQFDMARDILESQEASGDDRLLLLQARAEVEGEAGNLEKGWALLERALVERPGDADVLNAQCWYKGTWQYEIGDAMELCDRAVRASEFAASTLDSRALVHYRLNGADEALKDISASLAIAPAFASSLFLRGVIKLEKGDTSGRKDIADAKRSWAPVERYYGRFGVRVPN